MKKILRKSLVLIVAICATLSCFLYFPRSSESSASVSSDLAAARKQLDAIQSKVASLDRQIAAAKASKSTQLKAKQLLEEQIGGMNEEITALNSVINGINADIKEKNAELDTLGSEYDTDLAKFRERARASYESGDMSTLEVLMSSSSLSEMVTKLDLVSVVAEYDRAVIAKLQTQITRTAELKTQIETELAEQKTAMNRLTSAKVSLKSKESELNNTISSLSSKEAALAKEQAKYDDLESELDKKISALAAAASAGSGTYVEGELIWPLPGRSGISSGFGWRTLYGVKNYHTGIDIPAPSGTPIVSAADGTVIQSGWVNTGGGYKTTINHGAGLTTTYCHQSKLGVSVGQKVKKGEIIGYVGTTGNSTGNHLHFSIIYNGSYFNPSLYINPSNSVPAKSIKDLIG